MIQTTRYAALEIATDSAYRRPRRPRPVATRVTAESPEGTCRGLPLMPLGIRDSYLRAAVQLGTS